VQRGAFGACLMAEPALVADCVAAMRDAWAHLPVTVKHRIGIDRIESYDFVRDFVGTLARPAARGGCQVFIVHARNAWLKGLSPKENREVPPLRHALVHQLKRIFRSSPSSSTAASPDGRPDRRASAARGRRDGRPRRLPRALADGRLGRALLGRAPATGGRPRWRWKPPMVAYMTRQVARCALVARRAAHAGPVAQWHTRCTALAPGVVGPSTQGRAAGRSAGAQARAAPRGGRLDPQTTPQRKQHHVTQPLLAIIGGSGLYDLPGLTDTRWVSVDTPWGAPSDQIFHRPAG
jgi:hypothetical protein